MAVATDNRSATCFTESSVSEPGRFSRHKPDTKPLLTGASGSAEWESLSERFSIFSAACSGVLPPPTLAADLPKLNVVGSNPISRSRKANS